MTNTSEASIIISFVAKILILIFFCNLPLFLSHITHITGIAFEDMKALGSPN